MKRAPSLQTYHITGDTVFTASPVMWYVHVDHLNRPKKMTNASKASVWDVDWAPWGAPYAITGSATLDARFPGQWYQMEAGLHYNWHRHYDPTLGRYTQPDPLGFVDGPNVYAYARSSPVIDTDPSGLYAQELLGRPKVLMGGGGPGGSSFPGRTYVPRIDLTPEPPKPETETQTLCPPGDCTTEQHRDFQERVENACGSAVSCTAQDDPATLNIKISAHSKCIDARRRINNTCFRGGNENHRKQIKERQRAIDRCKFFLSGG